jgi:hypothetical protein
MIDQASRQLASGQEQLVQLLLTAIATYLMRGQKLLAQPGLKGST